MHAWNSRILVGLGVTFVFFTCLALAQRPSVVDAYRVRYPYLDSELGARDWARVTPALIDAHAYLSAPNASAAVAWEQGMTSRAHEWPTPPSVPVRTLRTLRTLRASGASGVSGVSVPPDWVAPRAWRASTRPRYVYRQPPLCGVCYILSLCSAMEARCAGAASGFIDPRWALCAGEFGCGGGLSDHVLRFFSEAGVLRAPAREWVTPNGYVDTHPDCAALALARAAPPRVAYRTVRVSTASELRYLLLSAGPLVVGLDARSLPFLLYAGGDAPFSGACGTTVNHAMLLVGYTEHAWVLQGPWGRDWGADGDMYLARFDAAGGETLRCALGAYVLVIDSCVL